MTGWSQCHSGALTGAPAVKDSASVSTSAEARGAPLMLTTRHWRPLQRTMMLAASLAAMHEGGASSPSHSTRMKRGRLASHSTTEAAPGGPAPLRMKLFAFDTARLVTAPAWPQRRLRA
eukprot:CAMPEP_0174945128 /NCGR_PEP_ID=MMETSP1355-20121228/80780_1 /TAXON_ID=464990 /ORGANISM="Hemiselmis tepida, Strain CCMP443" /LENGTH=118 /DNA_ID=CAMNT_0016192485 /DNA_START=215 /DNA_END=568 /DNA_ORIENTATION=+